MAKLAILFFACILLATVYAASDCPLSSKVTTCSPKCVQDTECSSIGGKCCPNICNAKSCLQPNQMGQDSSKYGSGYKGSGGSSATGSYCGNVKCNSYEKCDPKQSKCVRA